MVKKKKQQTKTCADCIHEYACRGWTDGRYISDAAASQCPNHETVKESSAYLCGVLDERKRKKTNADRIRAMSDEELAAWAINEAPKIGFRYTSSEAGLLKWLKQPAEEDD